MGGGRGVNDRRADGWQVRRREGDIRMVLGETGAASWHDRASEHLFQNPGSLTKSVSIYIHQEPLRFPQAISRKAECVSFLLLSSLKKVKIFLFPCTLNSPFILLRGPFPKVSLYDIYLHCFAEKTWPSFYF